MDSWFFGQLAFIYSVQKVRPTAIIDKCIEIWVDFMVPGRGVGERTWWMKGWRTIEQSAEKVSREADIRNDLWNWDNRNPSLHHELIVRYAVGFAASWFAMSVYNVFRGPVRGRYRHGK